MEKCKEHVYFFNRSCAAFRCVNCGNHRGMDRCYCGWSVNGKNNGVEELISMGETIEYVD